MIPKFEDAITVEWDHNDFLDETYVTVKFSASVKAKASGKSDADYDFARNHAVNWLRKEVFQSASETCTNVAESPKDTTFWPAPHFKCSECGATHVSMEYVFYCPNCGRKVVDE